MSVRASIPNEIWLLIVEAAAQIPTEYSLGSWFQCWKDRSILWELSPRAHPLVALFQTSRTLRRICAPFLWKDITLMEAVEETYIHFARCLKHPLISQTLTSLNIDMSLEYSQWRSHTEDIANALVGTKLVSFRFQGHEDMIHSPANIIQAVARGCHNLEHIELPCGYYPFSVVEQNSHEARAEKALQALSQVRSATLGLAVYDHQHRYREFATMEGKDPHTGPGPGLVGLLRGEIIGDPTGILDNKLVNIKTSAPLLYRHRCLVPAWARFNRIHDQLEEDESVEQTSFINVPGVNCKFYNSVENRRTVLKWVYAAKALRPALDRLLDDKLQGGGDAFDIAPEEVIDMIRSGSIFEPWHTSWFPCDRGSSSPAYQESVHLAKEVLRYWRKSARSRREDPGPSVRWHTGWYRDGPHALGMARNICR